VAVSRFLKFNIRLHVLWRTLLNAAGDIVAFMIIFFLIFFGFAAWGHYGFGAYLSDFHTMGATSSTLFRMMLGDMDYHSMVIANPLLAPVFVGTYGMTVVFIVLNVFIAIISEWYTYSKMLNLREKKRKPQAEDAMEYDLLKQAKDWFNETNAFRVSLQHLPKTAPLY
jgi:Na+-transporting methylmalonyl-CoA/oxaloacetate decarboxylase gamma subunit